MLESCAAASVRLTLKTHMLIYLCLSGEAAHLVTAGQLARSTPDLAQQSPWLWAVPCLRSLARPLWLARPLCPARSRLCCPAGQRLEQCYLGPWEGCCRAAADRC